MFVYCCVFAFVLAATVQAGLPEAGGFRYEVDDQYGNEQSHQQNRIGNAVNGQYKVLLPDGRLQTVTYVADAAGYRAKVDYTPAAPKEATTAGRGLPPPPPAAAAVGPLPPSPLAASRYSNIAGDGYAGSSLVALPPFALGPLGAAYGAGFGAGGFGSGIGVGGYDGPFGGVGPAFAPGAYAAGFGAAGPGYGPGIGAGYGTGYGYSSPIYGALGIPIGQSSASSAGYAYGYSTPFSQVYSYSNILG